MEDHESLTAMERGDEDCVLRFADGESFRIGYLSIRKRCQCAKCKPRQTNDQRRLEFEEEIERFRMEKPRAEVVGRYAIRLEWPSGCSSGIHAFSHLRQIAEELGTRL
ncbi:MAG: gamma-butyrobetaine hydroxylase-like domain-containing protein [Candidatus Thermoplasmatota archaeon]|nr:gamma-butyrobetaine hydroxylase-like domain-containing protein [Candidatus Thermoplasmatota archaeon]MED5273496.1 gamma-butyrobetaine hydroxylase-like domain-containing protein [Candidatus Thermoplasmatota archaeon]